MFVGTCFADHDHAMTPEMAHALGPEGIGFTHVRFGFDADDQHFEAKDGDRSKRQWHRSDASIAAITDAGMRVCLNVGSAPAFATEGKGAYREGAYGLWNQDASWPKMDGWHLAGQCADVGGKLCAKCKTTPDRVAWANDPPTISDEYVHGLGRDLAERYGELVNEFAFWNEPDETLSWPLIRLANLGRMAREEALRPLVLLTSAFSHGVRSVLPGARIVGPDVAYFGGMEEMLTQQSQMSGGLYDVTAFHAYSDTFPSGAIGRIEKEFIPSWRKFVAPRLYNRQFRISEIDDHETGITANGAEIVNFLRTLKSKYGYSIDGVNLYGMEPRLFEFWPPRPNGETRLTDLGQALADYCRELANQPPDFSQELGQLKSAVAAIAYKMGLTE